MTLQNAYWIALGALVLLITAKGTAPMIRTVLTLAGVGLVSLVLGRADFLAWPSVDYAMAMLAVDAIGGAIVLIRPAGKAQSIIGLTFLLQCGVHAGRILNSQDADIYNYWLGLSILAFLQIVIAGGWWINDRVSGKRLVRRGRPLPAPSNLESMEG
jgi:hypothetical protein